MIRVAYHKMGALVRVVLASQSFMIVVLEQASYNSAHAAHILHCSCSITAPSLPNPGPLLLIVITLEEAAKPADLVWLSRNLPSTRPEGAACKTHFRARLYRGLVVA